MCIRDRSYGKDYVSKPVDYNSQNIQENKKNLEKVSVYMNHPQAQIPKRKRFSNQIKSIFDHNMQWEQPQEKPMNNMHHRAKKTNLKLGFDNAKNEDFYKTSNQRYYSNKKGASNHLYSDPKVNFKDKNSRDHVVFGNFKNKYKTETNSNYLDYDIKSMIGGMQGLSIKPGNKRDPLSFGTKNNYKSTYGANFKEETNQDSLNTFVDNLSLIHI